MSTHSICAVVTTSTTSLSTDALTAQKFSTVSPKITPIGTSEILINISNVNTVPGVVGAIQISTASHSTTSTSSTATASVTFVALPVPTITASYSSLYSTSTHLQESTFIFIFYLCIWKYLGDLTRKIGHCIDKIVSTRIRENALTSVHLRIIKRFNLL